VALYGVYVQSEESARLQDHSCDHFEPVLLIGRYVIVKVLVLDRLCDVDECVGLVSEGSHWLVHTQPESLGRVAESLSVHFGPEGVDAVLDGFLHGSWVDLRFGRESQDVGLVDGLLHSLLLHDVSKGFLMQEKSLRTSHFRSGCNTTVHGVVSWSVIKKTTTATTVKHELAPLAIRFRPKDLEAIRFAAVKQHEAATVMIREAIMLRVMALEGELDVPKLEFAEHKKGNLSETISIRFRPAEYRRAARAATSEGVRFGLWARAIALEYIQRVRVPMRDRAVGE
jgi:hypothetical protein